MPVGSNNTRKLLKKEGIFSSNHHSHVLQQLSLDTIMVASQPRKQFEDIDSLATSIQTYGLLSPINVMENKDNPNSVILIAGERRLKAFQKLGRSTIPAFVLPYSDDKEEILTKQLIENIQRSDLNIIEIADSLASLKNNGRSIQSISIDTGYQERTIYRYLKINEYPDELKAKIIENNIGIMEAEKLSSSKSSSKSLPTTKEKPFYTLNNKYFKVNLKVSFSGKNRLSKDALTEKINELEVMLRKLKDISKNVD